MDWYIALITGIFAMVTVASCQRCEAGWTENNGNCYYVSTTTEETEMTWFQSRNWCISTGGDLVSVDSSEELDAIKNILDNAEYKGDSWIGLNQRGDGETFKWLDGTSPSITDWKDSYPVRDGKHQCVFMNPDTACFTRIEQTSSIKGLINRPSEASPPDTFQLGYLSRQGDDPTECIEKCKATPGCESFTFYGNSHPEFTWKGECLGRSNFTNTREAEENCISGDRFRCTGSWANDNCGSKKGFMCKKRLDALGPTSLLPTEVVPGYCPSGYTQSGNKCYKLFTSEQYGGFDWQSALDKCRTEPGVNPSLASFSDALEAAAVTSQLPETALGLWIGYYKSGNDWVWSDNSEPGFENWGPGLPGSRETCVEMWIFPGPPGTWKNSPCSESHGYICSSYKDVNNVIPTSPPTPDNQCQPGFQAAGTSCYKTESVAMTWDEADARCRSQQSHLVSIHSAMQNADVFLAVSSLPAWIGLKKDVDNEYKWSDGWPDLFTNWGAGEPTSSENCVLIDTDGKWKVANCVERKPAICWTTSDERLTTPAHVDGVCPSDEWIASGAHCFYIRRFYRSQSFDEAEEFCANLASNPWDPHLASITNRFENDLLLDNTNSGSQNRWIGLRKDNSEAPYRWLDGSPLTYTKWAPGEPNDNGGNALCVQYYIRTYPGFWHAVPCDETTSFFCKTPKGPTPTTPTLPPPVSGFCPGVSWEEYGEYCFLFAPDETVPWDQGRRFCSYAAPGATLASIRDDSENWFVQTKLQEKKTRPGNVGSWFGLYQRQEDVDENPITAPFVWLDGSTNDFTKWGPGEPNGEGRENCVEIFSESGYWNDHFCNEDHGYVCKVRKSDTSIPPGDCSPGWVAYGDKCYYFSDTAEETEMTWHESRDWCNEQGAELASVTSSIENSFLTDAMDGLSFIGALWLGFNKLEDGETFKWSDNSPRTYQNWGITQPSSNDKHRCASISSQVDFSRTEGWSTVAGLFQRPNDQNRPNTFYFGYLGSTDDVDRCEDECRQQTGCESYTFIKNSHPDYVWKGECLGRSNYVNVNESDIYAVSGSRVAFSYPGIWSNHNCGKQQGFICKKVKSSDTPITPPSTPVVPGYCPTGYVESGNICYKVVEKTFNTGLTWDQAAAACKQEEGINPSLASFHSLQDAAVVTSQLEKLTVGYWIGYYRDEGRWHWLDNSRLNFENWAPSKPSYTGECGEVWTYPGPAGTWNNGNCGDKRGYICQTYKDSSNIINTPPSTTMNRCPLGFQPYNGACYKLETAQRGWADANAQCRAQSAEIVSIHSEAENAAVMLLAEGSEIWIGLQSVNGEFRWSDGWPATFTKWAPDEPGSTGSCISLTAQGGWETKACTVMYGSICKTTDAQPPTTPQPIDGVCPNEDWEEFGGHCYYFSRNWERKSHESAEHHCHLEGGTNYDAHLASIHSDAENQFIRTNILSSGSAGDAWLGLTKDDADSELRWLDGSPIQYTAWAPGEPNDHDGTENCVEMYTTTWPGLWNDHNCAESRKWVCKTEKAPPPTIPTTPPAVAGDCPHEEWVAYGEFCFLFRPDEEYTWDDAQKMCVNEGGRGASLASIRNSAEDYFIHENLKSKWQSQDPPTSAWIGLIQTKQDLEADRENAPWMWFDGTQSDYMNWARDEPNGNGFENCVEIYYSTGEWNDHSCDRRHSAVCKVRKTGVSTPSQPTPTWPDGIEEIAGGMDSGHAAGIAIGAVIGIAILVAMVVGILFMLKRGDSGALDRFAVLGRADEYSSSA